MSDGQGVGRDKGKGWGWVVIKSRDLESWRIQRIKERTKAGQDGDRELGLIVKPLWNLRNLDSSLASVVSYLSGPVPAGFPTCKMFPYL